MKRKLFSLICGLLILLAVASVAGAQYAYEAITVSTTAVSLTSTTYLRAVWAVITVETSPIYFTVNGTTPTVGGVGHLVWQGQAIKLKNPDEIRNFKAIRASGVVDATIKATYGYE